jgi:hypothetical protein
MRNYFYRTEEGSDKKYVYKNHKEYLKNKNLHIITNTNCDDGLNINKLKDIKTYPNSKQYVEFFNCKKSS